MAEKKPYFAVMLIQAIYAGTMLLSKLAFNSGMKSSIYVFYRQLVGTAILGPLALIFERKTAPPISFSVFWKLFILSFIGFTLSLNLSNIALVYTTPTLAAAISNTLPVVTFIFAVLLRMETVKARTIHGMAKLGGAVACLGGVAILAFYKGPLFKPYLDLLQNSAQEHQADVNSTTMWIKGCLLSFLSVVFWGLCLVLQAKVMKSYPAKLTFTSLQCLLSVFQSFVVAVIWERDFDKWKLGFDVGLLAIIYCGIFVTAVTFYVQAWVLQKKGPVFQAMSTPLSLVMTISCSALLLGEYTSLGSILGSILLVVGLYSVLWGKNKEEKANQANQTTKENDSQEATTKRHQQV